MEYFEPSSASAAAFVLLVFANARSHEMPARTFAAAQHAAMDNVLTADEKVLQLKQVSAFFAPRPAVRTGTVYPQVLSSNGIVVTLLRSEDLCRCADSATEDDNLRRTALVQLGLNRWHRSAVATRCIPAPVVPFDVLAALR